MQGHARVVHVCAASVGPFPPPASPVTGEASTNADVRLTSGRQRMHIAFQRLVQALVLLTLVLAPGDVNLTFKEYVRTPIRCTVVADRIESIEGDGFDAELFESYLAAWGEADAYAVSHVGWGLNEACRWESLAMYDKSDTNGTELRAFAGNFLYSTGANEVAGRFAVGHFDLPMRHCTITLDGHHVVTDGAVHPL